MLASQQGYVRVRLQINISSSGPGPKKMCRCGLDRTEWEDKGRLQRKRELNQYKHLHWSAGVTWVPKIQSTKHLKC